MILTKKQGTLEYLTAEGIPVPHGFTTRLGGVSTGTQYSLNLAVDYGVASENTSHSFNWSAADADILGDKIGRAHV